MFIDKLISAVKNKANPTVIGLDPRLDFIPAPIIEKASGLYGHTLRGVCEAFYEFNKRLIDATYDIVPAVKLQLACYEAYGQEGIGTLERSIAAAKSRGMLVICDAKRGDIGSTAEAYSSAFIGKSPIGGGDASVFDSDAVTVNPFLGYDGIKPFIEDCSKYDKGIFILVKTSNKTSGQIQDLMTDSGKSIYETIAGYVEEWGSALIGKDGYSSVGAVVGATYPNQAKVLRKILKHAYILVPGYGAQGGTAEDCAHSFNPDGLGAIVNASRSIMRAYLSDKWKGRYDAANFDSAARAEALDMKDRLNKAIERLLL